VIKLLLSVSCIFGPAFGPTIDREPLLTHIALLESHADISLTRLFENGVIFNTADNSRFQDLPFGIGKVSFPLRFNQSRFTPICQWWRDSRDAYHDLDSASQVERRGSANIFTPDYELVFAVGNCFKFGDRHYSRSLQISSDVISFSTSNSGFSSFPKSDEDKEEAKNTHTHTNYRSLTHNPRPVGHDLLRFEIVCAALGFVCGIFFSAYAIILARRGDVGGFVFNAYTGGVCILLSMFLCLQANLTF